MHSQVTKTQLLEFYLGTGSCRSATVTLYIQGHISCCLSLSKLLTQGTVWLRECVHFNEVHESDVTLAAAFIIWIFKKKNKKKVLVI